MPSTTAEILEERWLPTTVQTAFVLSLPSKPQSGDISIDLPLLNLGWSFALSLTGIPEQNAAKGRHKKVKSVKISDKWIPETFSFHQHSSTVPWGNTSIHAQLSLGEECTLHGNMGSNLTPLGSTMNAVLARTSSLELPAEDPCIGTGSTTAPAEESTPYDGMGSTTLGCCPAEVSTPHNDVGSNLTPLGTMNVVLAQTSSLELPTTTRCTISSLQRNKVWLTVTISECPFANGLFQARSGSVNQAEVQAQLVRQSGDRLLSRSLATGKLFDVKFLTFSTSGDTGRLLPTYASLSVLEGHVNLSSCE
jgi:hypothetical protein